MQGFGFRLPLIEGSRDANGGGRGMGEFKANGHQFRTGIVVMMIVFHGW
jgi:hypothetical protein